MLRNYLVTALRRIARQRASTLINVLGLTLGIVCCLLIFLVIQYELGFDRLHRKFDRIYRVVTDEQINDIVNTTMGSPIPMAKALKQDFPGLEHATVMASRGSCLMEIQDPAGGVRRFQEDDAVALVEPEFFEIFDFPWLEGSPQSLAEPRTIALSETVARKYFGTANPIGRTITLDHKYLLRVVGILKDFPAQTDFHFTMVISWMTMLDLHDPDVLVNWRNLGSNYNTYLVLPPSMSPRDMQNRLAAFKNKYYPDAQDPTKRIHHLQPLRDVHFDPRYGNYAGHTVSRPTLLGLGVIGIFLIATACINFINMATAQSLGRSKEVGVRKVLGAVRSNLVLQYLGETFILTLLSALCAAALAEVLLPALNALLGLHVVLDPWANPALVAFAVGLVVMVSLLAGLYPAVVLSGFVPALALKGKGGSSTRNGLLLRRGLVIFQFVISQVLIIGTIVVTLQLNYWQTKEMGFDGKAMVVVPLPANESGREQSLRDRLLQDSRVHAVTFSYSSAASDNSWDTNLRHTLHGSEEILTCDLKFADADFLPTYALQLVAGRNYRPGDTVSEFVVNEAFARKLGIAPQDLLGKMFTLGRRRPMPVVGVVKDFHTRPLQVGIRPCLLATYQSAYQEASIKIDASDMKGGLAHIEKCWNAAFPDFLYSFQFLDERIAKFYDDERKTSELFQVCTTTAIFIGAIGLFGLISFIVARRTKEVGVRKVLGASVRDILLLFSREFAVLILIAFALAAPVAWLVMSRWLEEFAYRVSIGPGVFVLTIGVTFLIAALSIGYRALKASRANPVDSLRYE